MPSRNIIKQFAPESYYHIYNHGVHTQKLFKEESDFAVFLNIFKRHLSDKPVQDKYGREFAHISDNVELLAFCLLPTHFHLLVYNKQDRGIEDLMRRTMTAYSMYFNKRHKRHGVLFRDSYKASLITDDNYLWHISRYIHLNPQDIGQRYDTYRYSSYPYYLGLQKASWLQPQRILKMHEAENVDYAGFVRDYEPRRAELKALNRLLADH